MARIRSIKPEYFVSDQVVECSRDARLAFIGIWVFSDDQGVHPASPRKLKLEVFPGDDVTTDEVAEWVAELTTGGLLEEYRGGDEFCVMAHPEIAAVLRGDRRRPGACRRRGRVSEPATDYAAYLGSEAWQAKREIMLSAAGFRCQVCNTAVELEVHHNTYERLGHERYQDLVVLCSTCHHRHHGTQKRASVRTVGIVNCSVCKTHMQSAIATHNGPVVLCPDCAAWRA